jgi:prepilin-type N-terminal cleavage/methylation domain-containing protein
MFMSDKGYTIIEMLIAMAIVSIVLAGIYDLVISSSRTYLAQNAIVEMQADSRAAMDFMVRELRLACNKPPCTPPTISTNTAKDDTISFDRVEDTGYSSGGGLSTLTDSRKNWNPNEFKSLEDSSYTVSIVSGTGSPQNRIISGNSSDTLTVSSQWGTPPDATSLYLITRKKEFTRTSTSDNVLRYRIGATGNRYPLAENIKNHSFSQPKPTDPIRITLTGQTRARDPITKEYRTYMLTEDVTIRNK